VAQEPFKPRLDSLSFEVRYAFGHTYLDRCGQTIVDIERGYPGWVPGSTDPHGGNLENPSMRATVRFSPDSFAFASVRPEPEGVPGQAAVAEQLWSVVKRNLGLDEWVRVGCRFQYILAKENSDQVERALMAAPMQVVLNDHGGNHEWPSGYTRRQQQPTVVLERDGISYRIAMRSIIRTEGISAAALIHTNPKTLPRNRRKAQLAAIQARMAYARQPEHAVHLDIDCYTEDPDAVNAADFIVRQHERTEDFRFLLEGL
jgi:hypothetical protein